MHSVFVYGTLTTGAIMQRATGMSAPLRPFRRFLRYSPEVLSFN